MKTRIALAALAAAVVLACPVYATLTSTSNSVSYTGNGATTSFTVPFKFLASIDLVVTIAGVTKALTTDYAVSGAGNATGTVKFTSAPATGSAVVITRIVPLTQTTSFAQNRSLDPKTISDALDKQMMANQQLAAKEISDLGVVNNTVAAFNSSGAAIGSTTSVLATGSTTPRTLAARAADVANVKDFGAKGDGTTDDTAAIQAALNTGKDVVCPVGVTYKITNSLWMNTIGQAFSGACAITMDAGLAKPMLWLGATDANGTTPGQVLVNPKVRDVNFICTGTRTLGSAGIAFKAATTATVIGVRAWGCYAGIDVRGLSLVNSILNADLRQNTVGFNDRTDASTTINFQGSTIFGGRFEQNVKEGMVLGSADVRVVGTTFEGNSNPGLGGTGTDSEIRITPGFVNGSVDLTDLYMEILGGSAPTGMIQIDASSNKKVTISGGNYYGNDATNRCVINDLSSGTEKAYAILGGIFKSFKNYICGTVINNSTATIIPTWSELSRDATATLTASAGGTIHQVDRLLGVKTGLPVVSTVGSGSNAVSFTTTGARIKIGAGATDYLYSDGTNVKSDGNLIAVTFKVNGGTYGNYGTAVTSLQGTVASGTATRSINTSALAATDTIHGFYSDNASTLKAAVQGDGALRLVGVTFSNLGTPTNGTVQYCSDCTVANPCASGGTGALAKRLNGGWVCN